MPRERSGYCERCGHALAPDARFCESCGKAIAAQTIRAPESLPVSLASPTRARSRPGIWLIAGIAIALVTVCLLGGLLLGGYSLLQSSDSTRGLARGASSPTPTAVSRVYPTQVSFPIPTQPVLTPTPSKATASPTLPVPTVLPTRPGASATSSPTRVNPTPTPSAPSKSKPAYSAITFSSGFDETKQVPVSPGKTFPYGIKIIYAYWTYSGAIPRTEYVYDWYRDGNRVDGSAEFFNTASGKAWQWHLYGLAPKDPLQPGNYRFTVKVNGQVVLQDTFVIQGPAVGGPISGAISVFFTVQSGAPGGWVYDKQGVKHTPQHGTIGDIRVSAGDRIVLQTDQSRFSLLFDCSTTPGTFSPCDFSADSTSNLPKEIRVVKSGMSGYLNISRADNWAGVRPGFAPQRYPADPVLRVEFAW